MLRDRAEEDGIMAEHGKPLLGYSDEHIWITFVPLLAYSSQTSIVMQVRAGSRSTEANITEFVFQAAVPKSLQLSLDPPSGADLSRGTVVTQKITVGNPTKAILKLRLKISYSLNGQLLEKIPDTLAFPADFGAS